MALNKDLSKPSESCAITIESMLLLLNKSLKDQLKDGRAEDKVTTISSEFLEKSLKETFMSYIGNTEGLLKDSDAQHMAKISTAVQDDDIIRVYRKRVH